MATGLQKKARPNFGLITGLAALALVLLAALLRTRSPWSLNAAMVRLLKEEGAGGPVFSPAACPSTADPGPTMTAEIQADGSMSQRELVYQGYQDWQAGRCREAIAAWKEAVTLDPRDRSTAYHLGIAYCSLKMYSEAQSIFRGLGDRAKIREYVTGSGQKATTDDQKISRLEIAFCIDPSRVAVRRLQETLPLGGRADEIAYYLSKLVELAPPDSFDYWWGLGTIAEGEKNWSEARRYYLKGTAYAEDNKTLEILYTGAARASGALGDETCATYLRQLSTSPATVDPARAYCTDPQN